MMNLKVRKILIRTLKTIIYGVVGAILMLLSIGIYMLNQKADLEIWHTAKLDEEFTAPFIFGCAGRTERTSPSQPEPPSASPMALSRPTKCG